MKQLVITGGGGGLGRAVVEAFRSAEWEISAPGHAELDVTDAAAVRTFFEGRHVDLLVCAAGVIRDAPLQLTDENGWDEVLSVNFQGAAACAEAALPGMNERGRGHIIFISSRSALHPPLGQVAYATAKSALLGLNQELSRTYGRRGIRVNTLLPGFLETSMTRAVSTKRREEILASHHLGSFNTPDAVAAFIHFLHHRLPHTSGQVLQLDSRTSE